MKVPMEFKIARISQNLTQRDIEIATGGRVRQFEISLFERGKLNLPKEKVDAFAKVLKMQIEQTTTEGESHYGQ